MKKIDFILLTPKEQYDIAGALRGPDSPVVSDALKWPITRRIRYYVAFCKWNVVRSDAFNKVNWDNAQEKVRLLASHLENGSLVHWATHSIAALGHIRKICFPYSEDRTRLDELRISEIDAMLNLLNLVDRISMGMALGCPDVDTGALLPAFERVRKAAKAVAEGAVELRLLRLLKVGGNTRDSTRKPSMAKEGGKTHSCAEIP